MIDKNLVGVYTVVIDNWQVHKGELMPDNDLLTVTQAAEYLGMTRQAVHLLTKQGLGKRYGSVWMFTRSELDEYRNRPRTHGGRPAGSKTAAMIPAPVVMV